MFLFSSGVKKFMSFFYFFKVPLITDKNNLASGTMWVTSTRHRSLFNLCLAFQFLGNTVVLRGQITIIRDKSASRQPWKQIRHLHHLRERFLHKVQVKAGSID